MSEAADDSETPATWRDLLVRLQSATNSDDEESAFDLSRRLLAGEFDASDETNAEAAAPPPDVLRTVRSVHLRALLRLGRHAEAVRRCEELRKGGGEEEAGALREEEAYALYRLGEYGRARDVCRSALRDAGVDPSEVGTDAPQGLAHTYAQCLYRLGETGSAGDAYSRILDNEDSRGAPPEDEEEILANFLASRCSNRTYTGAPLSSTEETLSSRAESKLGKGGDEYNCDLACNLATLLLASASSSAQVGRALALLAEAERECVKSCSDLTELVGDVAPIRAQTAHGHLLNGDAAKARGILTKMAADPKAGEGVRLAAKLNLAIMDGEVGSVAGDLAGAKRTVVNPALVRSALYGRALVLLSKGDAEGCCSALADLRSSLDGGSGGGGGKKKKRGKGASSSDAAKAAAAVPAAAAASREEAQLWINRVAMAESYLLRSKGKAEEADRVLDEALDGTRALMGGASDGDDGDGAAAARAALRFGAAELLLYKSFSAAGGGGGGEGGGEDSSPSPSAEEALGALASLPPEVRSRPGVRGAEAFLHASLGRDDLARRALEGEGGAAAGGSGGGGGGGRGGFLVGSALADRLLRSGEHEAAAGAYRELLDGIVDGSDPAAEGRRGEAAAGLVGALSRYDPEAAVEAAREYLPELLEEEGGGDDDEINAEELEAREMPRISTGSRGRKKLAGTGGSSQGKKKRSRSSVLRRRARLREAHLKKLEAEGRIKPGGAAEPPKPDPERWTPKSQRSYSKRGRRGRGGRFTGAQGTGAGAERDAAKLDAMARKQRGGGGKDAEAGSGGPSTAHMEVAGSGTGRRKGGRR